MSIRRHPPSTDEFSHLVGQIYASAMGSGKMSETLRLFKDILGGTSAHTFSWKRSSGTVLNSQFSETDAASEEANQQYIGHWGALDPRAAALASLPADEVLRCHKSLDAKFVAASSFYQDYFIPRGFRWSVAGMFDSGDDTATVVAGLRAPDAPQFEEWAAAALRQLLPHFKKASLIAAKLNHHVPASKSAVEMLKALPIPCLFTDQVGRCIERNQAFSQAVEQLALRVVTGRVRFSNPNLQDTWETALTETHATALGQTISTTAANGQHWQVHLIPLRDVFQEGDAFDKKMIMAVFDEKPADMQLTAESLASTARLTPAEMEVLTGLLQGRPAKAIANKRGASVNTVRSQIVAILDKTGHKSQRELIASCGASSFGGSSFFGASSFRHSSFPYSSFRHSSFPYSSFRHSAFAPSRL